MIERATHCHRGRPNCGVRVVSESEDRVEFTSTEVYSWPRALFESSYQPLPPSEAERDEVV